MWKRPTGHETFEDGEVVFVVYTAVRANGVVGKNSVVAVGNERKEYKATHRLKAKVYDCDGPDGDVAWGVRFEDQDGYDCQLDECDRFIREKELIADAFDPLTDHAVAKAALWHLAVIAHHHKGKMEVQVGDFDWPRIVDTIRTLLRQTVGTEDTIEAANLLNPYLDQNGNPC